jgi:cytosine permease
MLPEYISKAVPVPREKRAPWYVNTAPSYAGVFLWVAFYQTIANDTISRAGIGVCLLGLAVAGLLSWALFYYAPAMLGMKTGYTLYVVGSSTFGTRGGYLMPGVLMGLLQVGWFAVATSLSTVFILKGANLLRGVPAEPQPGSAVFILVAVVWGYILGYVGVKGIQYVAKVALYLNLIAFLMVLVVFLQTSGGLSGRTVTNPEPWAAFTLLIQVVIGFFATAGAAGADFCMNNRNATDVRWGGFVGIAVAVLYAGGLPLTSVAGARALHPELTSFGYDAAIGSIGGFLATAMFFLFAIASIAPACFCAFITGNSFATMFPKIPRMVSTMTGVTIAIVLAITGVATNLIGVFTIVGASFGPICGAITADYLLSGRRWAGPREGINWAGYISWALGFLVGIIPFLPVSQGFKDAAQPAVVWSYVVGFVVYAVLAKAGLQPKLAPLSEVAGA